jgi:hypothetical protein
MRIENMGIGGNGREIFVALLGSYMERRQEGIFLVLD